MSDLRERLQELADAAARHGRTPGPQAALRQGRRRRLLLAGGIAAGLALVLLASLLGSDWLASRPAPLAPPATTSSLVTTSPPVTLPPEIGPPDVSISPDPGVVERPVGSPSGKYGEQMVRDVASEVARCQGGDPDGPKVLVAWGWAHGRGRTGCAGPRGCSRPAAPAAWATTARSRGCRRYRPAAATTSAPASSTGATSSAPSPRRRRESGCCSTAASPRWT